MILQKGGQWAGRRRGRILNQYSISQPSRNTETTTVRTAMISPNDMRLRSGSKRFATRLRMLSVAKPKTRAQRTLYMSPFLDDSSSKVKAPKTTREGSATMGSRRRNSSPERLSWFTKLKKCKRVRPLRDRKPVLRPETKKDITRFLASGHELREGPPKVSRGAPCEVSARRVS